MLKGLLLSLSVCAAFADVYATFEVKGVKEASLNLASSGIVEKIYVDVGSRVKKEQLLLSLQNGEEGAAVAMSKNEYSFLASQYERYKKSAEVFDKNTLEKVKAETERAKNALALNTQRLEKTRLKAPFAGVIAEKNIEIGDAVGGGGKPLFRLISFDTKLVLSFDSKYVNDVKAGSLFCYRIDGKESGKCLEITKIYPAVNSDNKKLNAESKGGDLKVGIFGDGFIKSK